MMTVDPRLRLTPGEYLIHPDGSASRVVDRRNMTVDEILATGKEELQKIRDQHVCQGLRRCLDHPVPHVLIAERDHDRFGGFMVYPAGNEFVVEECDFHDEAMDAARALAVGE